jgi:hypothetical protein
LPAKCGCEIKVGQQYQYEESQSQVLLEVIVVEDRTKDDWVGYTLRIVRSYRRGYKVGDTFECGCKKGAEYSSDWKLRPIGSAPDYGW